jgi:hypothetical protein
MDAGEDERRSEARAAGRQDAQWRRLAGQRVQAAPQIGAASKNYAKSNILALAERVADGEVRTATKAIFVDAARRFAEASREDGETIERARARYWQTDEGRILYAAMKRAPHDEPAPAERPALTAGMAAFHKAAEARAAKMGVSVAAAKMAIVESRDPADVALWRAARA